MRYRRKTAKPSVALWMLVALGDAVLLLASIGVSVLFALLSVVTVTAALVGGRIMLARRGVTAREGVPTPVAVPVTRRRA
ncbi:hypothetical protein O7606_14455 [Micromonospora sp. WMMD882]|uniref:hypothetical protein n=1 Tax=Micromonospora sp. WMMD882 TaxID=3015151 RepID=UPI00248C39F5|nr:hypothetical protein [Micromonospora sp. WMMD882]WBB77488.1 hypothetical protein O7606_14455 [Micromonospora sp. WMMD882]